jgi:ABC-2 type transport system ATP-binding protein
MDLFQANNVVKEYAGHVALSGVSITVKEASVFGLLGPNGAGKTTLIRIINQITAPDSGELYFEGRPLKSDDIYRIGYLPEERGLYKKMKVGEQAVYLAQLKGMSKKDALKNLKYWFEKFEIQAWWGKKVEELSKGMAQKVQFITTVIHRPKLLIFDEPFTGFDPIHAPGPSPRAGRKEKAHPSFPVHRAWSRAR